MDHSLCFTIENRIEFRKDHSDAGNIIQPAVISIENGKQIVRGHEPQLEAISVFLLVLGQNLQRTTIVSRDEQVVRVFVSEIGVQTCQQLLNHGTHQPI